MSRIGTLQTENYMNPSLQTHSDMYTDYIRADRILMVYALMILLIYVFGGPEKGLLCWMYGERLFKPWTSRTSWGEGRPGCWAGHLPGRW